MDFLKTKTPIASLCDCLFTLGYDQLMACYGGGKLRGWDFEQVAGHCGSALLPAWKLFACGEPTPRRDVEQRVPGSMVDDLLQRRILRRTGANLCANGFVLSVINGCWAFVPSSWWEGPWLADAALAAASSWLRRTDETWILFSLTGLDAVLTARKATKTICLPAESCEQLVRLNCELNAAPVELRSRRDWDGNHPGFKHTVACATVFASTPRLKLPPALDGGLDGARRMREIVKGLKRLIRPDGGSAEIIGLGYCRHGETPSLTLKRLLAGLDREHRTIITSTWKMSRVPSNPVNDFVLGQTPSRGNRSARETKKRYYAAMARQFDMCFAFKTRIPPHDGIKPSRVVDLSSMYYGTWFI